jgi:hypothetical protein
MNWCDDANQWRVHKWSLFIGIKYSNAFSPGIISLLWCRVTTAATSSSTVTLRKNGANANNTFSINANTTGAFSDTTPHNDSIAIDLILAVEVVAARPI